MCSVGGGDLGGWAHAEIGIQGQSVCVCGVGKPSGGGKREPPPPCVCVWQPCLMGTVVGVRANGKETIYGSFRTKVSLAVMAAQLSGPDPN